MFLKSCFFKGIISISTITRKSGAEDIFPLKLVMGYPSIYALKLVGKLNNIQERAHHVFFTKICNGHRTLATCCSERFLHFQRKCRFPSALDI